LSARMDMNNAMALSSRRWYSHGLEFSTQPQWQFLSGFFRLDP